MYENKMTFKEAYMLFWKNGLNIKSRARRKEYWAPMLINHLIYSALAVLFIIFAFISVFTSNDHYTSPLIIALPIFYFSMIIFNLVLFIPNLTVTIRRFHDVGYSGWTVVIAFISYIVLGVLMGVLMGISATPYSRDLNGIQLIIMAIFLLAICGVSIWLIITTIRDSKPGANKWGPNPKEVVQTRPYYNDYQAGYQNNI